MSSSKHVLKPADKTALLTGHPLFRELPAEVIERIASYMTRRAVPRGKVIFEKGDAGSGLMGVLSGTVRISVQSADGKEIVLNQIHPGEIFGEIALLDSRPRTATATAATECDLMVIDRREFVAFLRSEPDIALKFIEILCARIRRTSAQLEEIAFMDMPCRLAKTLLHLMAGKANEGMLPITQRELGQIIGTSRESTNKQLRAWEKKDWIRLERGGITILEPDQITRIADGGSNGDSL
jgi:CRP/FNR family transcriptional regulator, cyclic AMP receptor protein